MSNRRKLRLLLLGLLIGGSVLELRELSIPLQILDLMTYGLASDTILGLVSIILPAAIYWLWSSECPTYLLGRTERRLIASWRINEFRLLVALLLVAAFPYMYWTVSEGLETDLNIMILFVAHPLFFLGALGLLRYPYNPWRLDLARMIVIIWAIVFVPAGVLQP